MPKPSKILVLSLTRMGDIVQSIPFFKRLRARHPEAAIHVLVEECFTDVAAFLPGIDRVIQVRLRDLLPDLAAGRNGDLYRATAFYRQWVAGLVREGYDEVWNLTHTRPATVLNHLLAAEKGCGVTLDNGGLQLVNSKWLVYFYATNLARPWCQYNLADIYANCVDGVDPREGRSLAIDESVFASQLATLPPKKSGATWIAVHAGASQTTKQWPVQSYRKAAEQLARHAGVQILLIGGRNDLPLAAEFAGVPGVLNYIGKTTPLELAALLSRCELVLSNDSGPMHIAAMVGTPVLDITIGSALGSETAPYGEGHMVIEPRSECFPCSAQNPCPTVTCAKSVTVEAVTAVAERMLGWRRDPSSEELDGCRVYTTGFSHTDGMLELRRVFSRTPEQRDELNGLVRGFWLPILNGHEDTMPTLDPHTLRGLPAELLMAASSAQIACRQAEGISRQLANAARHKPARVETIDHLAMLLSEQEATLEMLLNRHGLLRSFHVFTSVARGSLAGGTLEEQALETASIYADLNQLLRAFVAVPVPDNGNYSIDSAIEVCHEDLA